MHKVHKISEQTCVSGKLSEMIEFANLLANQPGLTKEEIDRLAGKILTHVCRFGGIDDASITAYKETIQKRQIGRN